jgi:prepilin-type N-terminal cleavage/methylation domain-containing protein
MSKILSRIKRKGFTLVELLVVIAIIGILVSIVMPAITDALTRGKLTQMAANGRNLIQALMSKETQDIYTSQMVVWPKTGGDNPEDGEFDSSTSFFYWLVTNGIMNVNYNFFAGPGVPAAPTGEDFVGDGDRDEGFYTAWCIAGDVGSRTPETTPVLFTKNLGKDGDEDGQAYDQLEAKVFQTDDDIDEYFVGEPFQSKGFVFVTKGGSAVAPFKDDMRVQTFTNLFKIYPDEDDVDELILVLRPNASDSGS